MTAPTHPPFPLASFPRRTRVPAVAESQVRVGDAERGEACELLNQHFAAGRLTHPELDERLADAMGARTRSDLQRLFLDLPRLADPGPTEHPGGMARQPSAPAARRTGPAGGVATTLLGLGGLVAIPIVCLMLFGSLFFGPAIFIFSLIGGSLAALSGAALAHFLLRDVPRPPR